jgi:cation transport ATPase
MEHQQTNNTREYVKFFAVIVGITGLSLLHFQWARNYAAMEHNQWLQFLDSFMGVFFLVFSLFKIAQLKEFVYGFQSYDVLAKRSLLYSYAYPFLQLGVGLLYLYGINSIQLDSFVLILSLVSGAGVLNSLLKKQAVHCVCLGNVIKLPLSRVSFVEDFGMALMATAMIITR